MKSFLFLTGVIAILSGCGAPSVNLIQNPSAEIPRFDTVPAGWTNVEGNWKTLEGDSLHHDYGYAQDSSHYFFAGTCLSGTLQQDVDVEKYASGIDAKKQQFMFSAFVLSLDQGPNSDQAGIRVMALNKSKDSTLFTYDSDTIRSISKWQRTGDTFIAPPSTRYLRVQLMATRHVGADNDGYIDNVVLTTQAGSSLLLWLIIAAVIALAAGVVIYIRRSRPS